MKIQCKCEPFYCYKINPQKEELTDLQGLIKQLQSSHFLPNCFMIIKTELKGCKAILEPRKRGQQILQHRALDFVNLT